MTVQIGQVMQRIMKSITNIRGFRKMFFSSMKRWDHSAFQLVITTQSIKFFGSLFLLRAKALGVYQRIWQNSPPTLLQCCTPGALAVTSWKGDLKLKSKSKGRVKKGWEKRSGWTPPPLPRSQLFMTSCLYKLSYSCLFYHFLHQ